MNNMHGTTIVGVRKNGSVTIAGDGQVSLGNTVDNQSFLLYNSSGEFLLIMLSIAFSIFDY